MRATGLAFIGAGMLVLAGALLCLLPSQPAAAHCDTMGGPVVMDAKAALETGKIARALKWVKPDYEPEIRAAFEQAERVRRLGPEAQELADQYFFETLVRLHRAGEGAPYTGLKPAGAEMSPIVVAGDKALETGAPDHLVQMVTAKVEAGLRERFMRALEARKHMDESVAAGRGYVEAYVEYMHYAERLYDDATGSAGHGEEG